MKGPLDSLKVLDFSALLPGPYATMVMADLGADVVRVEGPGRPDMARFLPPFDADTSAWHGVLNRNKRSLALDLKRPEAAAMVHRLVGPEGGFDIVIEQFRPGVMDRLGLGYEALRATNPRIIYCAITGYGQTGPWRDKAGHDLNFLALSGALNHSGRRGERPPLHGLQVADVGGAFGALVGVLAAVIERDRTAEGQYVDISMFDLMVAWQAHTIAAYLIAGDVPEPEGMLLNGGHPYDTYWTADDRALAVASLEPKFWEGFCQAIGRPDLIKPGLTPDLGALGPVKAAVAETLRTRTLAEWLAIFEPLDVCVEPVLTVPEMLEHPQSRARELLVETPTASGRRQRQIGSPFRLSGSRPAYQSAGAPLGAHSEEVLAAAGYSIDEITLLRASGVIAGHEGQ
jgi:crotonobetainyl-CoA:carnitine CoA-transferase CaiB-like acyl-CoA transferase